MNVELMRAEIKKAYKGVRWENKVKKMPEAQVIAVYHEFMEREKKAKTQEMEEVALKRVATQALTFDEAYDTIVHPTNVAPYPYPIGKMTIRVPYTDTMVGAYTVCPKEVMLKGWEDTVGKTIVFDEKKRRVERVNMVAGLIFIDLSKPE